MARRPIYLIFLFLLFSLFFKQASLYSQEADDSTFVFNPIIDDITQRIPPLETLIDSAIANSPFLKNSYNLITSKEYELASARNEILRGFGFLGNLNWGRYSLSTLLSSSTEVSTAEDVTLRDQLSYSVGVYLRVSIYDIVNRKNQINIARKQLEAAINSKEEQIFNLKKEIATLYNNLILKQMLLKTRSDNLLTSEMRMVMVEKRFVNSQISLEEMSRLMEFHADGKTKYEISMSEFMEAYSLLELTCGMKFNLLNKID